MYRWKYKIKNSNYFIRKIGWSFDRLGKKCWNVLQQENKPCQCILVEKTNTRPKINFERKGSRIRTSKIKHQNH